MLDRKLAYSLPRQIFAGITLIFAVTLGISVAGVHAGRQLQTDKRLRAATAMHALSPMAPAGLNLTVTNTNDSGPGSLRQALIDASNNPFSNAIITVSATGTITLLSALPDIRTSTTISGPGANVLTVVRSTAVGTPAFRIFHVSMSAFVPNVQISGLTIKNGSPQDFSGGAGIWSNGNLTVNSCVISDNNAGGFPGGGIRNAGADLIINRSTIARNNAGAGGAVFNDTTTQSTVEINDSTISGNVANASGGGVLANAGIVRIIRSTITGNRANGAGTTGGTGGGLEISQGATIYSGSNIVAGNFSSSNNDVLNRNPSFNGGAFWSFDYNLFGNLGGLFSGDFSHTINLNPNTSPGLAPLADNGGPTPTHMLRPDSPAIDQGSNTDAPATDQRGRPRAVDGSGSGSVRPDIGAVEFQPLIVTNASNSGTGSLRQALIDANGSGGGAIHFQIPATDPNCDFRSFCSIKPTTPLPIISQYVRIDGYTQTGAQRNSLAIGSNAALKIELSGELIGFGHSGLEVTGNDAIIEGLVINRFVGDSGVSIESARDVRVRGNYIGTNDAGNAALGNTNGVTIIDGAANFISDGNLISGNSNIGIAVSGISASGNVIAGNYIGTNYSGTVALGNGTTGISLEGAPGNFIGQQSKPNVISGNVQDGIAFDGAGSNNNEVVANYIGTDPTGFVVLGNRTGVHIFNGSGNRIGKPSLGNIISGNVDGIVIGTDGAAANFVQANTIGNAGIGNRGNGIVIINSNDNQIGSGPPGAGNQIEFNSGAGVFVVSGLGNSILGNSIFSNGGLGIDLGSAGVTVNDNGDTDSGANYLQNYPIITSAIYDGTNVSITGALNSTPSRSYTLEFFSSFDCDPSGSGEGAIVLGRQFVTTDANGNASFNVSFNVEVINQVITATATYMDPTRIGNSTSEFSPCKPVTVLESSLQFTAPTYSVNEDGMAATITVTRTGSTAGGVAVRYSATGSVSNGATGGGSCDTPGVDFIGTSGSLIWTNGDASPKTFSIPICNDHQIERSVETVDLVLSDPTPGANLGAQPTALLLIHDNDEAGSVQFSSSNYSVNEANATVSFTVTRTGSDGPAANVDYVAASGTATGGASCTGGSDFVNSAGTLTWAAGDFNSRTVTLTICRDQTPEPDETINLSLVNPNVVSIGPQATSQITIVDNDNPGQVEFSAPTYTVGEASNQVSVTVTRTSVDGPAVSIDYGTSGVTASGAMNCAAGTDFVNASGTLTWTAGDGSSRAITITLCNDTLPEGDETFNLNLTNPTGGLTLGNNSAAVVTITDDEFLRIVTNTNDSGAGSLRQALLDVNSLPETGTGFIRFSSGLTGTIELLTALPDMNRDAVLEGPGANLLTLKRSSLPGTANFRVLHINTGRTVKISGLKITNGVENTTGGGILNEGTLRIDACSLEGNTAVQGGGGIGNQGSLTLTNSTVANNTNLFAGNITGGGGIYNGNSGNLNISDSTISGNSSPSSAGFGGGVFNEDDGTASIANTTITANTAAYAGDFEPGGGGGIYTRPFTPSPVRIAGSIIAGNNSHGTPDLAGDYVSGDYNLIGSTAGMRSIAGVTAHNITNVDARLGPLADNGGPTQTHALLPDSPAIDKGDNTNSPTTDQRGLPRVLDGNNDGSAIVDIGAFELQSTCSITIDPTSVPAGTIGIVYQSTTFTAGGGTLPYVFDLQGSLPSGLTFANGLLSGTPLQDGQFPFTITATDIYGCRVSREYTLSIALASACAIDVTSQLSITRGGFSQNLVTHRFRQSITIRNDGATAVVGPIAYALDNLAAGVLLYNPAGVTVCALPAGSAYALVPVGNDNQLTPGESVTLVLEYTKSNVQQSITYTPRVLAGSVR